MLCASVLNLIMKKVSLENLFARKDTLYLKIRKKANICSRKKMLKVTDLKMPLIQTIKIGFTSSLILAEVGKLIMVEFLKRFLFQRFSNLEERFHGGL